MFGLLLGIFCTFSVYYKNLQLAPEDTVKWKKKGGTGVPLDTHAAPKQRQDCMAAYTDGNLVLLDRCTG